MLTVLVAHIVPALVAALATSPPEAEPQVGLLLADPGLHAALAVSLAPWGYTVTDAPSERAPARFAGAPARSSAESLGVTALVWLCQTEPSGERSLCLYDARGGGRLLSRKLELPLPLEQPDAAAVALSIKAFLLSPPPPTRPPAPPPTSPPPTSPPPSRSSPAQVVVMRNEWPAARVRGLSLEAGMLARVWPVAGSDATWRARVAALYWPARLARRVGLGLGATFGPAADAVVPGLAAQLSDVTVRGLAQSGVGLGRFRLQLELGPSLHILSLSGTAFAQAARATSDQRVDVSLDGALTLKLPLGRFFVGAQVGGFVVLERQRYLLAGIPLFTLAPLGSEVGAVVGVKL
jgi:hypothetical protein